MKKALKIAAVASSCLLAISVFAACGEKGGGSNANTAELAARICYDNLPDDGISLAEADTQVKIKGATDLRAFTFAGKSIGTEKKDLDTVATYSGGVFTAKGTGVITFKKDGVKGRVEVVPAYITNPGYQYGNSGSGIGTDMSRKNSTLLGETHDPSFVEAKEGNKPVYYIFSTGWKGGNDIHKSYDLLSWEYLGQTVHGKAEAQIPAGLREWANLQTNEGTDKINWWAPDIVPAPDGGYWLYTCTVQPDDHMPMLYSNNLDGATSPTGCKYSQASIVLYHTDRLDKDWSKTTSNFEYVGVLMQSAIPQNGTGDIDINSIDPQIIYTPDGKMYMAYGSFGTGNWILELDPQTGLRKDGVYADGQFKSVGFIRRERNKVVSGDENTMTGTKYKDDFLAGQEVTSEFYGKLISLGAEEAPVIARHDNVQLTDENGNKLEGSGKTYYYSMHSYNWLAENYQMWGGRSESVVGPYQSVAGGLVYNDNVGSANNQGNKYMGAFRWRAESMADGNKEITIALPGHNDLYTTEAGANIAAYITRTWDTGSELFCVQLHQYYLNSYGDICINPNRYGLEIDRTVTEEELLEYTDGGKFEMVVLANQADARINGQTGTYSGHNTVSVEVVFGNDHTIKKAGTQIGTWKMYGKGYIKLEFTETQKASNGRDSGEKVYYGVVRPAWLGNRNRSGFTITAMGHTESAGKKMNMPIFFNNYSTLTGENFVG